MRIINKVYYREILFVYALITVSLFTYAQKLKYYENIFMKAQETPVF